MRTIRVIAVLAIAAAGTACSGDDAAPRSLGGTPPPGCTAPQEFGETSREHVNPPQTVEYLSNPPTVGRHYGQWAPTGVHPEPIRNETQVHNLEHGHVGIQYLPGALDAAALEALQTFTRDNAAWVFMAPKPDLAVELAFSAWRHLQVCDDAPADPQVVVTAARGFVERFGRRAPEEIPGQPRP